jgi:hypothetical protein
VSVPKRLRGLPVPGQEDRILPGQAVMARAADDLWHEAIATTGVIYGYDFEVVRITKVYGGQHKEGVPFPAEDVLTLEAFYALGPVSSPRSEEPTPQ